jgi:hypothetical protein
LGEYPTRVNHEVYSWSPEKPFIWPTSPATYRVQWTTIDSWLTFDAGEGAMWRTGIPAGWTRVNDTRIERIISEGMNWNSIQWPTSAHLRKEGHTPSIPARPVGTVPEGTSYTNFRVAWTPNQVTVTLHAGTGGSWESAPYGWTAHIGRAPNITQIRRTQAAGSEVIWPEYPTRANHTLTSWSPARPETWPTAPTTYRAQWSRITLWLTFDAGDGGAWNETGLPAGWARATDTTLWLVVGVGENWNTIEWPTAAHLSRQNYTPSIPARPIGSIQNGSTPSDFAMTWTPIP